MRVIGIMAVLMVLSSCTEPGTETDARQSQEPAVGPGPSLRTDSASYSLKWDGRGWSTTIGFQYQNTTSDTIYVLNCNQHVTLNVQKRETDGWTDFWYGATNGCMSPPIVIAPGAVYRGELPVWGAQSGTTSTTAFASDDFTGTYRIKWNQLVTHYTGAPPQLGDTLPENRRVSNDFTFRVQRP
jgi:hypothetical protein